MMDISAVTVATHRIRLLPDEGKIPCDEEAQTSSTQFRAVGETFAGKLFALQAEKATTAEGIALSKRNKPMDIPRIFTISESEHRIHNPFTAEKYATLGHALRMKPGTRILDLGSGSGEMLCTWARDYGVTGTGIDINPSSPHRQNNEQKNSASANTYILFITTQPIISTRRNMTWRPA